MDTSQVSQTSSNEVLRMRDLPDGSHLRDWTTRMWLNHGLQQRQLLETTALSLN